MKKEATLKNAKELIQKISDEKRGNPKKRKGAYSKTLLRKKRQPQKAQRGLFIRPPMKKEATPRSEGNFFLMK
jgi:hypothetical protein